MVTKVAFDYEVRPQQLFNNSLPVEDTIYPDASQSLDATRETFLTIMEEINAETTDIMVSEAKLNRMIHGIQTEILVPLFDIDHKAPHNHQICCHIRFEGERTLRGLRYRLQEIQQNQKAEIDLLAYEAQVAEKRKRARIRDMKKPTSRFFLPSWPWLQKLAAAAKIK